MEKKAAGRTEVLDSVIQYVRINHPDTIDKAYDFFWDDCKPDESLGRTALSIGFVNFEDWLIFDYLVTEEGTTFIDMYGKDNPALSEEEQRFLAGIRGAVLSLYEVTSVARDKRVVLKDLLLSGETEIRDKALSRGLRKGDIFATRMLPADGKVIMGSCVYPFSRGQKKVVLDYVEREFRRYRKNANPGGTMRDFLKEHGDIFNVMWTHLLMDTSHCKR